MNIVERAKNILLNPKAEWDKISEEETSKGALLGSYVVPLALIPAIAGFIGNGFIESNYYNYINARFIKLPNIYLGILSAVIYFKFSLLGVIITSFVVNALAPIFGSQKNPVKAMQLVAYSLTPIWVGSILYILPSLNYIVVLIGSYGFNLVYLGLPKMMKTPKGKVLIYLIVSFVVSFVAVFVSVILVIILVGFIAFLMISGFK
jgi:hypothetical protein